MRIIYNNVCHRHAKKEEDIKMLDDKDWGGWLVQIKPEMLNPEEPQIVYVVLEDRGPRILIQELPQYKSEFRTFLHTESVLKEWVNVIDDEIQKRQI
jgi:hypothetical protein